MVCKNLKQALGANTYPGRGIILGNSADGAHTVMAYFIMGRSENSRNRLFAAQGTDLKTKAFDESKMQDPSLIIYAPVRVCGARTVVTNGDQTDTIAAALAQGGTFEEALRTRTFEPDAPNFTPRISGLTEQDGRYRLSILKTAGRFFFEYEGTPAGEGHLIHTYQGDGNPLPSFEGEPVLVRLDGDMDTLADTLWNMLDAENKVSLFVRFIHRETGEMHTRIINKWEE